MPPPVLPGQHVSRPAASSESSYAVGCCRFPAAGTKFLRGTFSVLLTHAVPLSLFKYLPLNTLLSGLYGLHWGYICQMAVNLFAFVLPRVTKITNSISDDWIY
jgi:hypothetical protein